MSNCHYVSARYKFFNTAGPDMQSRVILCFDPAIVGTDPPSKGPIDLTACNNIAVTLTKREALDLLGQLTQSIQQAFG
jgi:hypothetical protein